jgi:C-1 hydroxylase
VATDANKAVVRSFVEAWNTKDFDRFDALMAEDAHLTVGGSTISCSPAATRAIAEHWTAGFPDYHFDLVHMVAEGDLVGALMPFSGTHARRTGTHPATVTGS